MVPYPTSLTDACYLEITAALGWGTVVHPDCCETSTYYLIPDELRQMMNLYFETPSPDDTVIAGVIADYIEENINNLPATKAEVGSWSQKAPLQNLIDYFRSVFNSRR